MTKVKICGLTHLEDALAAENLGAWGLGFIFHNPSKRYLNPKAAALITSQIKQALLFGVFVNASLAQIESDVKASEVTGIQLHGEETPEFCLKVRQNFPTHGLIKALRLKSEADFFIIEKFSPVCDWILLDSSPPGMGILNDFGLVQLAIRTFPKLKIILAGGLTPLNVREAIQTVNPFAVDCSSGVEAGDQVELGTRRKDPQKLQSFFQNSRVKS